MGGVGGDGNGSSASPGKASAVAAADDFLDGNGGNGIAEENIDFDALSDDFDDDVAL